MYAFLLTRNAILKLLLVTSFFSSRFHFNEPRVFLCPMHLFIYISIIFIFIVFLHYPLPLTTAVIFLSMARQYGTSHRRRFLQKLRTNFCPQQLLVINLMSTRRELLDIVPGTPEAEICSKSKSKVRIKTIYCSQSSLSFPI